MTRLQGHRPKLAETPDAHTDFRRHRASLYVRLGMKARLIAVLVGAVFLGVLGFAAFAMWMNRPSRIMDATP